MTGVGSEHFLCVNREIDAYLLVCGLSGLCFTTIRRKDSGAEDEDRSEE